MKPNPFFRSETTFLPGAEIRQALVPAICFSLCLAGFLMLQPAAAVGQTAAGQTFAFEPEPDPADEESRTARRTVLQLEIERVGTEGPRRSIAVEVVNGPPRSELRRDLGHDDLPLELSFSVGILDPDAKVAEVHFYRTDEGPSQGWIPFQKALIDGQVENQVELARDLTLSLWWVELRDETIESVDGELVYRPVH